MLVSIMQLVAMHSAVVCIVCNFVMFVVDAIGDHIVEAYSSIGLATSLYVESNVSLCLPYLVEDRTLNIDIVLDVLAAYCQCLLL